MSHLCFAKINLIEGLYVPIVIHVVLIGNLTQYVNNGKFSNVNHVFNVTNIWIAIYSLQMRKESQPCC